MDGDELKELLAERLHIELQLFKDSLLQKGKEDIFQSSYKIEIYVNLYEIFGMHIDNLEDSAIRKLLRLRFGILETVYQEWLEREDGFFGELSEYACRELESIVKMERKEYGKGDGNEERPDKAA